MIIGSIVAIAIFVWFYNSATTFDRNPLHWAIAGVLVYFTVGLFWTFIVNPSIKDAAMHSRDSMLMYIARYAYIVVALACTVVFHLKVGQKKQKD